MSAVTIRSLTLGLPFYALGPDIWKNAAALYDEAAMLFSAAGMEERTRRLVFEPVELSAGLDTVHLDAVLRSARENGEKCGIRWYCLPFRGLNGWPERELRASASRLLRENPGLFLHYMLEDRGTEESLRGVAAAVLDISRISNNGFDNFRVGAGANIVANTPFFPFSWHDGEPAFSLAVESLAPLLRLLKESGPVDAGDEPPANLVSGLANICGAANKVGLRLEERLDGFFRYRGIDISLAPYPDREHSIALLMERLGLFRFGGMGTSGCTLFLTNLLRAAIRESGCRVTGFNGVMFSPLEDSGIARSFLTEDLRVEHFMLWSTLCGCGVDMIPLGGTTTRESLAALYRDILSLSRRHAKPLGVRVLPIPGRRPNEITHFNHDFLVNCRILDISGGMDSHMI